MKEAKQKMQTIEEAYEAERLREKAWRKTKQGAFESSFVSLDAVLDGEDDDSDKLRTLSDHGRCAARIRLFDEVRSSVARQTKERQKAINRAVMRLRRHAPHLLDVFWLIIKNGKNRRQTIWELSQLLKFGLRRKRYAKKTIDLKKRLSGAKRETSTTRSEKR